VDYNDVELVERMKEEAVKRLDIAREEVKKDVGNEEMKSLDDFFN